MGANIRSLRKSSDLTMGQLAARCARLGGDAEKLTEPVITNIELGRRDKSGKRHRDITIDEIIFIAAALSVPPAMLMPPALMPQMQEIDAVGGLSLRVIRVEGWNTSEEG